MTCMRPATKQAPHPTRASTHNMHASCNQAGLTPNKGLHTRHACVLQPSRPHTLQGPPHTTCMRPVTKQAPHPTRASTHNMHASCNQAGPTPYKGLHTRHACVLQPSRPHTLQGPPHTTCMCPATKQAPHPTRASTHDMHASCNQAGPTPYKGLHTRHACVLQPSRPHTLRSKAPSPSILQWRMAERVLAGAAGLSLSPPNSWRQHTATCGKHACTELTLCHCVTAHWGGGYTAVW